MNHYERLQLIRRLNQQAPLKIIEALRAEGMWAKVTFHEDGRIYTVEEVDPVPACFEPTPGVSVLGPSPTSRRPSSRPKVTFHEDGRIYTVEEVDPVPACFEPTPGVSVLGPIPYQPAPVEPGNPLRRSRC